MRCIDDSSRLGGGTLAAESACDPRPSGFRAGQIAAGHTLADVTVPLFAAHTFALYLDKYQTIKLQLEAAMAMPDTGAGTLYIDGKWRHAAAGRTFPVTNPATSEILAQISAAEIQDVREAVAAAECAFPGWAARTAYERAGYLQKAHRLMLERAEDLARLMTTEQGKPLRTARIEVEYAADFLIWFAEEAKRVYGQTIPSARADQRFMVMHQPVGVVGAMTPWNYPISMITRKVAPALAAGCTIVLKPAEQTPLCAVEMFRICMRPASRPASSIWSRPTRRAIRRATSSSATPLSASSRSPGPRRSASGWRAGAAGQMKRVSLELGGHAPFIVFADADPAHAAKGAALVKFLNTGQACICPNRIFVHRS